MKPIKLVIKGLNSFYETQTIDFNKLTERGLFGIFGPTGSGKSTILDGITLALYGKTSRNSSNFINTHCEEMSITYEFLIRDAEVKHYVIDRTFKRNKDGRINAKKPTRIIEIVDGDEVILEEATTAVDKKCIDIMGLKFEDFIRTVVLPQGKFSEFLKLEGKPRREMLERLFSLDKYGDGLARKLGFAVKSAKSDMDKLIGQLKGYEDINEASYAAKKNQLAVSKAEENKASEQLKSVTEKFGEYEKIWALKEELASHKQTERELKAQKENIETLKHKVLKGESSLKVKPYIDNVESTLKDIGATEQNISKNNTKLEKLSQAKDQKVISYMAARSEKDIHVPKLKVIDNNVEMAMEEEIIKKKLEQEVTELRESYGAINSKKLLEDKKILKLAEELKSLNESLNLCEKRFESLNIEESERSGVQKGLIIEEKLKAAGSRKDKLQSELEENKVKSGNLKKNIELQQNSISEKNEMLKAQNEKLKEMLSNSPGDANLLLTLQSNISAVTTAVNSGKAYKAELEQLNTEMAKLNIEIEENTIIKTSLSEEVEELKKTLENNKQENLANILRRGLTKGMPCPVCGSLEHKVESHEIIDDIIIEKIESELVSKEEKLRNLENKILEENIKQNNNAAQKALLKGELEKLGQQWETINIEALTKEFNQKKASINEWTITKEKLEAQIKILNEELNESKISYSKYNSTLTETESAYKKDKNEFEEVLEDFNEQNKSLASLKSELKVDSFSARSNEIKAIDNERNTLEKTIKAARTEIKQKETAAEISKKTNSEFIDKLATLRTQGEEKKAQVLDKEKSIKNKVGEVENLAVYKEEILNNIKHIETVFITIEGEKNALEEQYNKCEGELKAQKLELEKANARIAVEKLKLQGALTAVGYKNSEEALQYLVNEQEIKELKETIKTYENNLLQLKGKIQEVIKKLGDRDITFEQWTEIKLLKEKSENELKTVRETVVRINTELNELKKKLDELKDIMVEKSKLDHKLSLLNDLDSLFKGKRFVEFVAIHQLKYVSLEASKRLMDITAGNYGLEVDEEGKFIIRDYKNGGATRDASTLSGGETFLASLSLALALSAQIQLKGTAPLELFFLDEGFGTLDDNLLDVVMNSLENIYNDKLSVGIISHVESIKNRVPIKLIVTPATAGLGGSKVTIER